MNRLLATVLMLIAVQATGEPINIDMSPGAWDRADRISFADYLGEPAAMLSGGPFAAKGVDVTNGRIDVDVAMHGQRGFIGVIFRHQSNRDYELVYLRPHKSGQPDALQYTPAINGLTEWQLYSEGYMSPTLLPENRWVHLTLVFKDRELKVYIDNREEPELTTRLQHPNTRGSLGLWGGNVAHFANFRYEDLGDTKVPPLPKFDAPANIVSNWQLSPVFELAAVDRTRLPTDIAWQPVEVESPGMLNVSRYRTKLARDQRTNTTTNEDLVFARTTIQSDGQQRKKLWFGYSDNITVLVNGKPVYEGYSSFDHRYPFALGILGLRNDAIFVDLEPGENEIVFAVSEVFGGWGIAAEFENIEGIRF